MKVKGHLGHFLTNLGQFFATKRQFFFAYLDQNPNFFQSHQKEDVQFYLDKKLDRITTQKLFEKLQREKMSY